jgi:hypothetical protein
MLDQFEEIRPFHRIAAREDHQGGSEESDLFKQAVCFGSGQLACMAFRLGGRAAVNACQIACLSGFPDDQQRALIEIHLAA